MEERKINFKKNDDNTQVLDPDGMLYEKLTEKQKKINEKISLLLYMLTAVSPYFIMLTRFLSRCDPFP